MNRKKRELLDLQTQLDNCYAHIEQFRDETIAAIDKMEVASLIKPGEYDYVIPTYGEVLSRLIRLMEPTGILPAHLIPTLTITPPAKPKTRRVLLVDSDPETRRLLKEELAGDNKYSFIFNEAESLRRALEILENKEPDFELLVFDSDLETQAMDTPTFLEEAKKYFPKIRIVYTANQQVKDVVESIQAGADHVIDKQSPGALAQFHKIVREYLDRSPADNNKPSAQWLEARSEYLAREYKDLLVAFIDGRDVDCDTNEKRLIRRVYRQYKEIPYLCTHTKQGG